MADEHGYFSSFDGIDIFYRAWRQSGPKSIILVHGIGEHTGRYEEFVRALEPAHVSIFAFDLRGHGRSGGQRVDVVKFSEFVQDLFCYRSFIEKTFGVFKVPPMLMGHSLGGLIATSAALENQELWSRLILSSPFFGVSTTALTEIAAGVTQILSRFFPAQTWKNPIRPVFLTHDEAEQALYKTDPLIFRQITSRMLNEMFKNARAIRFRARELILPLLVVAAGNDKIVSLQRTKEFFAKAQSRNKILKVFEGFYHELFHERDRALAFSYLCEYLKSC